jgi:surfactin synthase thioesterase subunit
MPVQRNPWILGRYSKGGEPRIRMICFAHAGGGAGVFAAWRAHLPTGVDLLPVQLPGHETRHKEPYAANIDTLAHDLLANLESVLTPPFLLFGHSFGALLAYEVACELRRLSADLPAALVVSAAKAPQIPRKEGLHTLSDEEMIKRMSALGGLDETLLDHTGLLHEIVQTVRADLRIAEHYVPGPREPLPIPLYACGGLEDPAVPPEDVEHWRGVAGADFATAFYPGGHFYPYEDPAPLLGDVARLLTARRLLDAKTTWGQPGRKASGRLL